MEITKYQNPTTSIEIASRPHKTALIVEKDNSEISVAIKTDLPVRSYEENLFKAGMFSVITKIKANAGSKIDEEMETNLNDQLQVKIIRKYPQLTLKEIDLALSNGIDGEYGEWFGLNVATCMKFINAYCKDRQKLISKLLLQADVDRIKAEDLVSKSKQIRRSTSEILISLTDMLVIPKTEYIKGKSKSYTFNRYQYKNMFVDVLIHKNQVYARRMKSNEWNKVDDIDKVKEYLVQNAK